MINCIRKVLSMFGSPRPRPKARTPEELTPLELRKASHNVANETQKAIASARLVVEHADALKDLADRLAKGHNDEYR